MNTKVIYNEIKTLLSNEREREYARYKRKIATYKNNKSNATAIGILESYFRNDFLKNRMVWLDTEKINLGIVAEFITKVQFLKNKNIELKSSRGQGYDAIVNGKRIEIKSYIRNKPSPLSSNNHIVLYMNVNKEIQEIEFYTFKPGTFEIGHRIIKSDLEKGIKIKDLDEFIDFIEKVKTFKI